MHWDTHKKSCMPPTPEQEEERKRKEALLLQQQQGFVKPEPGLDVKPKPEKPDDIIEGDTLLTLMCPLSISRIDIPAKGSNCDHTQIGRAVQQECRDRSRMPSSA
eukprot:TRINITY_DN31126_c0_g1_i4.p1 TRINITY_DN31126_c0_g1~~TRINITY_DN31126_c0_g1_i4.p1  ORF type:complete len:105 (+),score=25.80 TRINITY_DN31126_c0_g1_i4:80-394(+)